MTREEAEKLYQAAQKKEQEDINSDENCQKVLLSVKGKIEYAARNGYLNTRVYDVPFPVAKLLIEDGFTIESERVSDTGYQYSSLTVSWEPEVKVKSTPVVEYDPSDRSKVQSFYARFNKILNNTFYK